MSEPWQAGAADPGPDDDSPPDVDDDDEWFTCDGCGDEFSRSPLTLFRVDQATNQATHAWDYCERCFGAVTGMGIGVSFPRQWRRGLARALITPGEKGDE